jgi:hypothetical protein
MSDCANNNCRHAEEEHMPLDFGTNIYIHAGFCRVPNCGCSSFVREIPSDSFPKEKPRAHYIGAPEFFHLNMLCQIVNSAFGDYGTYLVGSALKTRNYRDVDLRHIMADEQFDKMFPSAGANPYYDAYWSLVCSAISEWLSKRSGLPIDFQIQKQSDANKQYPSPAHPRNAVGLFFYKRPEDGQPAT